MSNYTNPDVYIEDVVSGSSAFSQIDSSVGAMVGAARSGSTTKAQLCTSWNEFISNYASGLDTPFLANSYLPYAVYGFFANGGKSLYIVRVASEEAEVAKAEGTAVTIEANSVGTWGNDITVSIKKNEDYAEAVPGTEASEGVEAVPGTPGNLVFDVTVTIGTVDSVTVRAVTIDTIEQKLLSSGKAKYWLGSVEVTGEALVEEDLRLTGGVDGVKELKDNDYIAGLSLLDEVVPEVTMVSIPGIETDAVRGAVIDYCEANKLFPVISVPYGSIKEDVKEYRKTLNSTYGAIVYPWCILNDPLTSQEKAVPPEGFYMGVAARTISGRGVFKAPAGISATIRGIVGLEFPVTKEDVGYLNPLGVVCLCNRKNYGDVVWGARGLNSKDDQMKYVSDHFLNINIRRTLYESTQFAVFEPNDSVLWAKVYTVCRNFLDKMHKAGAFVGAGEGTAWYVTVDESNNSSETINDGELNIEVGYAPVKPAEFVIIKLAHSIANIE